MKYSWLRVNINSQSGLSVDQVADELDRIVEQELGGHVSGSTNAPEPRGQDDCVRCLLLPDDVSVYRLVEKISDKFGAAGMKTDSRISSSEKPPMQMLDNSPVPQAIVTLTR
jgi:hypothetical protein